MIRGVFACRTPCVSGGTPSCLLQGLTFANSVLCTTSWPLKYLASCTLRYSFQFSSHLSFYYFRHFSCLWSMFNRTACVGGWCPTFAYVIRWLVVHLVSFGILPPLPPPTKKKKKKNSSVLRLLIFLKRVSSSILRLSRGS